MRTQYVSLIVLAASAAWLSLASAQTSTEIEQLRREYDQQLRVMQQAFEERMTALEEATKKKDADFSWYWKDGLRFDTADGRFKMKLSGRIQWENAWFNQDSDSENGKNGEFEDASEFRRAEIEIGGTIYEDFGFNAQYDFAEDGESEFKDVWMSYNNIPIAGSIRAGHFKEPFSLEELTSDNNATFIERGYPNDLAPKRNGGIAFANAWLDERLTAAAGVFRTTDDDGDSAQDGGYSVTGRITGRPWLKEEGDGYLHLGAAASFREDSNEDFGGKPNVAFTSDGEVHLAPTYLDSGDLAIDGLNLYGLEAALVYKSFHAAGEYILADVNQQIGSDLKYGGYYLQAGWFITGESKPYRAASGIFDTVKPKKNFQIGKDEEGWGAWEIAARYSGLDLDDSDNATGDIEQGESDAFTAGVNWYLNPNMRLSLNYNHVGIDYQDGTDEDFDAVQTRMQVTW